MGTKINKSDNLKWIKFGLISVLIVFWLTGGVSAVDIDNCTTLDTAGETYILTTNIIDSPGISIGRAFVCMDIQADNIILDCQGRMINGDGTGTGAHQTYGVYLYGTKNVEVRNCIIDDWYVGVDIDSGENNSLIGNNITSNNVGILMCCESYNNSVYYNNISSNDNEGVSIGRDCDDTELYANTVCYNPIDIRKEAPSTSYGDNNSCNNPAGWDDTGTRGCTYSCPAIPELSCYCSNCSECETKLNDPSCSFVYLTSDIINISETCIDNPEDFNNKRFDCQGHTIDGVDHVLNQQRGIYLGGKSGNEIRNCIITDFFQGIVLSGSTGNTLTDNIVNSNQDVGILLSNSTDNTLTDNIACLNHFRDIIVVNTAGDNFGSDNICNKTYNWNDEGVGWGCTAPCSGPTIGLWRLFILDLNYKQYLEDGEVNAQLRNAFIDEKIYLSSNATISKIYEKNWIVIDGVKYYRIEESDEQLNIYGGDVDMKSEKLKIEGLPSEVTAGKEIVMFIKDEDGNPVDGVEVKIEGKTYKTDVNGKVKVKFDKVGSKVIEVSKEGYESKSLTIEVRKKTVVEKDYTWLWILGALISTGLILFLVTRRKSK